MFALSIKEIATYSWTIDHFSTTHSDVFSPIFTSSTSASDTRFTLGLFPKQNNLNSTSTTATDGNDVFVCLWIFPKNLHDEEISVQYKLSIVGANDKMCHTKECQWKYDSSSSHSIVNFISRAELLNPSNGLLVDDKLTIFCEIYILNKQEMLIDLNQNSKIIQDYQSLLESGKFSDILFLVRGTKLKAHKAILSARSPVFAAMFEHETKETLENVVEITDIPAKIFEILLQFLYTGKSQLVDKYALELLQVSEKYQVEDLKSQCEHSLCANLTVETVTQCLLQADLFNASLLKAKCIKYITENATEVMLTDQWDQITKARPELVFQLYRDMAIKNHLSVNT